MKQMKEIKFQLRLTKAESAMLKQQAHAASMTKTRYITYLIEREHKAHHATGADSATAETPAIVYKDADLRKLLWHLSKWGNNLNQASHALNALAAKKYFSEDKAFEILIRAAERIDASATAIERIAVNVEKLQDERHVVMGD